MSYRPYRSACTAVASHVSRRLAVGLVLGVVALFTTTLSASASPSIGDKRAQAAAILAEVQSLDEEVGAAAERFNGASYELQKLSAELSEARGDLAQARELQKVSRLRIAARLRALYVGGEPASAIEVILGADSLDGLLDRIDVAGRVVEQDARIAREARSLRERVARRARELAAALSRQRVVVEQRAAERRAIEGKLAERQRLLSSVKEEIARLQEAERRRQVEFERRARLELERQRRAAEAARSAPAVQVPSAPAQTDASASGAGVGYGRASAAQGITYEPPPADASRGAQVVAIAMQFLGVPYVWAASDPSVGFDCSGLTKYVFAKVGVSLPHYAAAQYQLGSAVSKDQLQPGDLVFFRGLGHMGMYIGGGNMIHAPRTGDVVKISSLSDPYYVATWVGARRVL